MSKKYKDRSDADIIGELTSNNPDAGLVDYFFFDLCKKLLKDISKVTRNDENYRALIGEFYEYLSENNWKVLRQYQGRNNATLMYYLSYCANNHYDGCHRQSGKRCCRSGCAEYESVVWIGGIHGIESGTLLPLMHKDYVLEEKLSLCR